MTRILVTGGRDFNDQLLLFTVLDHLHNCTSGVSSISTIIHGAASGADSLAETWARLENIPTIPCPADWKTHGKAAGPIRNRQMLEEHKPDLVVAFPGGRGTANMVALAQKAGVRVVEVTTNTDTEERPS